MQFEYIVQNKKGLHVQVATKIVQVAQKFQSTMTISAKNKSADLKKVFGIVGLGVKCGESIFVTIEGEDSTEAFTAVKQIIEQIL